MNPNGAAVSNTPPPSVPPPPGGGSLVTNPHYQASVAATQPTPATQPTAPAATTASTPPKVPPPPNGGNAVPNPHYQSSLPSTSATDASIPAFLRSGVDMGTVQQTVSKPTEDDRGAIADVHSDDPNHIRVFDPGAYNADVRNHELTHVYQNNRSPDISTTNSSVGKYRVDNTSYDYGGQQGLVQARNAGKTIANFGIEQQAEMVEDYKHSHDAFLAKVKDGTATKKDLQAMSDLQNAYHPFMQQMADMPGKNEHINPGMLNLLMGRNMPTINTTPSAPGLPSFATAGMGMVTADPLMGGQSQAIHHSAHKGKQ